MAFYEDVKARTYISGEAIAQFAFVTGPAADGQIDVAAAGGRAIGVALQAATGAGEAIAVAYDGRVMVKAAGVISAGGAVASDVNGEAVAAVATDVIVGYALEDAVDNQIITIELSRAETVAV